MGRHPKPFTISAHPVHAMSGLAGSGQSKEAERVTGEPNPRE
jgi:hypothetical protein